MRIQFQRCPTLPMLLVPLCLAVLRLSAADVQFPLNWRWSNPTPHGNNIIDVAGTNHFWVQVAERGQIYTSMDLAVWIPRESHTTAALRSVTFFKNQIVAVGEAGTVVTGPSATDLRMIALGTDDWLEGVAASAEVAVAVGDNGAVYTSVDAMDWRRQMTPFNDWLRSITFGTPGASGLFVAVGEEGLVATSPNGTNWRRETALTPPQDLNRVIWFNGEFLAVGNGGVAFQSTDGRSWTSSQSGATNALNAVAALDSARLVAGDSEVRVKFGRASWNDELASTNPYPPPAWTYLSASVHTNSFLLCGRSGMLAQGILTEETTVWISLSDSPRNWLWDVKRFPEIYLAVGDRATLLSSADGISWETELPPDSATNAIFLGIGGRTNLAVAVGQGGVIITSPDHRETVISTNSNGQVVTNYVSTLGIRWNPVQPLPTTSDLQGITAKGDQLVISGAGGLILTSSDGQTWTPHNTPTSSFLSSVESFPGGFVAVGRGGAILTSPDAVNWTARNSGTTNWIYRVRYLGDRLVAVGQNGTILTSQDGLDWSPRSSHTSRWLNDVQWIGNTYFAVGNQGAVLSSPDSVVWHDRGTITGKSLFAAAHADGQLIVVGVEGVVLRTQAISFEIPVSFLQFPTRPQNEFFLFSGQSGQKFTLDRSTDLRDWTSGAVLQIEPSGTLQHHDSGTNGVLQQFFRTTVIP